MSKTEQGTSLDAAPGDGSSKVSGSSVRLFATISGTPIGDGTDIRTVVGKRITIGAVDGDGHDVTGCWQIDGALDGSEAVKDYDCDWSGGAPAAAAVHLLTDADLKSRKSSTLAFYWIKPGVKHLSFKTDPKYGGLTLSMTITVIAPILSVGRGVTTEVVLVPNPALPGEVFFGLGDHFKRPKQWPGIRYEYLVVPLEGCDGQIAGVQLIWVNTLIVEQTVIHKPSWKKDEYWLDTRAPYAKASDVSFPAPTSWVHEEGAYDTGDGIHRDNFDMPGRMLTIGWTECHADEHFQMYLMYRPAGSGKESIWVTLGRIAWWWRGDATNPQALAGEWSLANASCDGGGDITKASTRLPTWQRVFNGGDYRNYWDPPI